MKCYGIAFPSYSFQRRRKHDGLFSILTDTGKPGVLEIYRLYFPVPEFSHHAQGMIVFHRIFGMKCYGISFPRYSFQRRRKHDGLFIPFSQIREQRELLKSEFISLLDICTDVSDVKQVHALLYRRGFEQCSFVLTKFIRTLTKIGISMDDYARILFQRVQNPNPFLWTALIRGYALKGCLSECVKLYNCMRRDGTRPGSFAVSALFKACSTLLNVNLGWQIHGQTIKIGGFENDLHVNNTLVDMYVKCGVLDYARKAFDEMPDRDIISWTSLIVSYTKNGEIDAAWELFDGLVVKDTVSWTAMISGCAQNARPKDALDLFERLVKSGGEVDEISLTSAISACAQLGAIANATWIQDIAKKAGFGHQNDVFIGSALIDMYSNCGCLEAAYEIFKATDNRNIYSYTSMIVGYAMYAHADRAVQLFYDMVNRTEIKPNGVTFIAVLTACAHAGRVEEGCQLFASMTEPYGVAPSVDHYTCMVDLLGRAGHLGDALDLVKSMPMEPNAAIWGSLLGACRIHQNPEIAEIAAKHLFKLEPDCKGNYDLLASISASAERWDDVSSLRTSMKQKKLRKYPGCSWVEGKEGAILEFYADDLTHPNYEKCKQILDELLEQLKLSGYQPHLALAAYDVRDDS